MADSYLTITPSAGNRRLFTISFWVKRSKITSSQMIVWAVANKFRIEFGADDTLIVRDYGSGYDINLITTRLFRDTTSWYHIVVAVDTAQAAEANRVKIYVNGEQETKFDTATYPAINFDSNGWNTAGVHDMGREVAGTAYLEGQLAHFHGIDGTAYAASTFGETDSTTGEWKPILAPSVTYGSEGFFLKFENSGALGTDSSGNGNNWTVNGSLKQSISTVTNNFATFDLNQSYNFDIIMGGTGISSSSGAWNGTNINYGMLKGKWYAEFKCVSGTYRGIGFFRYGGEYCADVTHESVNSGMYPEGYFYKADQKQLANNNSETTYASWSAISDGDILMLALDLDNGKAWYGVNGTWNDAGSGTGVPNTGAFPHHTFTTGTGNFWGVSAGGHTSPVIHANFGEGRFGTTALASANNDNAGAAKGTFEYAPPAGFYSICTDNIKEYG